MARRSTLLIPISLAATLSGCMADTEISPRIGGVVGLEAIETETAEAPLSDQASLASIDRTDWEEIDFLVPVDNRYLFPGTSLRPAYTEDLVRQRSEFPTIDSSVELSGPAFPQQMEAGAAPFWAAWDFLSLPRALFGYVPHRDGLPLDWRDRAEEDGIEQPVAPTERP